MAKATTSNSNWWLLARTLRRGDVDNSLVCCVAWLHKRNVFLGVVRAQRFKHTTSHEASPFSLGFLCHLSAPHPRSSLSTFPPKCPHFATGSPFSRRDQAKSTVAART
jgi:hypothetical protein